MSFNASWPKGERSTHYQEVADKLRGLAASEHAVVVRARLLALAEQYQKLATNLKPAQPDEPL